MATMEYITIHHSLLKWQVFVMEKKENFINHNFINLYFFLLLMQYSNQQNSNEKHMV